MYFVHSTSQYIYFKIWHYLPWNRFAIPSNEMTSVLRSDFHQGLYQHTHTFSFGQWGCISAHVSLHPTRMHRNHCNVELFQFTTQGFSNHVQGNFRASIGQEEPIRYFSYTSYQGAGVHYKSMFDCEITSTVICSSFLQQW